MARLEAPHGRTFIELWGACLVSVWLFDFLFFRRPVGWTAGGFLAFLTVLAFWRFDRLRHDGGGKVVALGCLGLAAGMINEPSTLLVMLAVLGLLTLALIGVWGWNPSGIDWARSCARLLSFGPIRVLRDGLLGLPGMVGGETAVRSSGAAVAWVLPLVVTLLFLFILALANPIIDRFSTELVEGWVNILTTPRLFVWLGAGLALWTWMLPRIEPVFPEGPPSPGSSESALARQPAAIVRSLIGANGVFALQSALDLAYLWGGAKLPEGMSYAEYAHRGAYPLIVAALLAGAFVLVVFRPDSAISCNRVARLLVFAWLAQTVMLTVSAMWRLGLYIEVYGLTRWRISAGAWMVLIAVGLIWVALRLRLHRPNVWLVNANLITATVVLIGLGLFNVDGLIADYNVTHCREVGGSGPALDVDYLASLGPEALPALTRFAATNSRGTAGRRAAFLAGSLESRLERRLGQWRGWTWRRHRLWTLTRRSVAESPE